jgi:protein-tyrosine kinase
MKLPILSRATTSKARAPKSQPLKSSRRQSDVEWRSPSGYQVSERRVPTLCTELGEPSFIELATTLGAGHFAQGRRGLAVCGAAAEAGVSFIAVNLASAMALGGTQTLLVEANLRSPALATAIRPPHPGPGLSELLLGEVADPLDVLHPDVIQDLSIVYAGDRCTDAADRLTSARFSSFAQACLRDSACTIFDTPPANRSVDARVVAREAGYALIVARQGRSFYEDVETLSAELMKDGVIIVGAVMNRG